MIEPGDIQEQLDKVPFEPFRVVMYDGNAHEILNPDLAVPMERMLFLVLPGRHWKLLSYEGMSCLESIADE